MDPVSQAALGAAAALIVSKPKQMRWAAPLGALSGMAPDLDVFIRSSTDPLLFLEYHRQFTHSLFFIPVGALLCSLIARPFIRSKIPDRTLYGFCLLGFGSHGLLDACTSYGTQLFWPFTDLRIAWNNVSVVDPLFTLPLLIGVVTAVARSSPRWVRAAAIWAIAYLLLGVAQRERAEAAGFELAASRGHAPSEVAAKPSFGNLLLWKTVYEHDFHYYVDATRVGVEVKSFPGQRSRKVDMSRDLDWLDLDSQQARDLERFRWFSNGKLGLDPDDQDRIIDIRYSMVPNQVDALWGIELDETAPFDAHVRFFTSRSLSKEQRAELQRMLFGP